MRNKKALAYIYIYILLTAAAVFTVLSFSLSAAFALDRKNDTFWYYNIVNQMPSFLIGVALFYVWQEHCEKVRKSRWLVFIASLLLTALSVCIFFSQWDGAFVVVPLIASLAFAGWFLWIDSLNVQSGQWIEKISKNTLEIFVVHPFLTYYGIGYAKKLLEKLNVHIGGIFAFAICYCIITAGSILLSKHLGILSGYPYKKYIERHCNL